MTKVRVGINGFGRIGRNIVRAIYESGRKDIDVVAVNDLGPVETNAHLLQFDSVHGRFPHEVTVNGDSISIGSDQFKVTAIKDPSQLPWKDLGIDIALKGNDQSSLLHAIASMRDNFAGIVGNVRQGSEGVATASAEIAKDEHDSALRARAA